MYDRDCQGKFAIFVEFFEVLKTFLISLVYHVRYLLSIVFATKIATIRMVAIHCATHPQSLQSCRRILLCLVVLQWPEVHLQFS